MNKSDLAQQVAQRAEISQKDASSAVDAVFDQIAGALAGKESVTIAGFGKFETRDREGRMGRNPATGESVMIAAKTVPAFKAARALRDRVDG